MQYQHVLSRQMFRSSQDKVIWGVCGGIAEYFGVCSFWVRLAALILGIMFFPVSLLVYVLARMMMPSRTMPSVPHPLPPIPPMPDVHRASFDVHSLSALNDQFDRIEEQVCRMEDVVTSREFVLRREFEKLNA